MKPIESIQALNNFKTLEEIGLFLAGVATVFVFGYLFGKLLEKIFNIHLT